MPKKHRSRVNLPEIAQRLSDQQTFWRPLVHFDPVARYYVRLAAEPDFEAWLLTWVPGQGTEWHDHGGSAGVFVSLQGTLTERTATVTPDQSPRISPTERLLTAGTVRPFGTKHVHRVTNHHAEPAVSLHVYSPALVEMNHYVADGDRLELVALQLEGVNW